MLLQAAHAGASSSKGSVGRCSSRLCEEQGRGHGRWPVPNQSVREADERCSERALIGMGLWETGPRSASSQGMGSGGIVSGNRDIMVWSRGKLRSGTISRASLLPCIAFAKMSLFRSMGTSFATSSMPDKLLMLFVVLVILRLICLMVFFLRLFRKRWPSICSTLRFHRTEHTRGDRNLCAWCRGIL